MTRKFAGNLKLVDLIVDCVDEALDTIIEREGLDKPFSPFDYIYHMFLNIMAATAFGTKYDINDPEYKSIKYVLRDFFVANSSKLVYWEFFPILRKLDAKVFTEFKERIEENLEILKKKYQSHYRDYDPSVVRDLCDTLITAKNEALREGKDSTPHLTDDNLAMAIFDVFFAGTDTSQTTFRWLLLYLTHYAEVEKKLREEIASVIGDRMPTHEDRNRCHYVMAFISEVMRVRNIAPQGLQHKTMVTTKLGDYTLPRDTQVIVFQGHILRHQLYWPQALHFRPDRFLHDGKYLSTKPKAFIPFGVGRRVCLAEKLAIADLFLVLVRFLQKTSGYEIVLHSSATDPLDADPDDSIELHPVDYKISLRLK